MGLFNFNINTNNNDEPKKVRQEVILQLNEETVTVPASQVGDSTVQQLFQRFASTLGDISRVTRYVAAGKAIDGSEPAKVGNVYRAAISSEAKG